MERKMDLEHVIDMETAEEELKKGYAKAEKMLKDEDKIEKFLQRLEKKLEVIPVAGDKLGYVPIMASLLKSFVKKEYTTLPLGTIIAVLSALIYFVSPVDLLPDFIPGVGHIDDALVVLACWRLVENDILEYKEWREKSGKMLV